VKYRPGLLARPFFARFLGKHDILVAASAKNSKKYHFAYALIGYFSVSIGRVRHLAMTGSAKC
jgi:hypothetical protein